ncbi:unnamed protein product [Eruca vesicaria subsp. sativa]|uniref:Uncharacterized protein n=1 Tax=Eruca vesicaria subsp. sativa TaxID=29727 RepID=A0ABC8JPN9_ERUVS|nr:unnamed protein product [Eruca vesicaria subsp. sativa]
MASNKFAFFLLLCLCVLSTAEFGEAQNPTGRKCPDPNGVDRKAECYSYCRDQGFLGGYMLLSISHHNKKNN